MQRLTLALAAFSLFILSLSSAAFAADAKPFDPAVHDWPHDVAGAAPDPRLHFGRLENGLRYVIVPAEDEKERLSVRLRFDVGRNDEPDEKYGIAHLLEHMAFKGSRDIAPEDMMYQMQELGMSMGPDINAFTADKFTFYMFDFPDVSEKNLDLGLHFLSQVAQHLTLKDDALATERDVVIAESLLYDTARNKAQRAKSLFYFPEDVRLKALTGGSKETLASITTADLRAFYNTHYQPDNALIVVLGSVNKAAVIRKISETFSGWRAPGEPAKVAASTKSKPKYKPAELHTGDDVIFDFSIMQNRKSRSDRESEALLDENFAQDVAQDMFRARLDRRADNNKQVNWIDAAFLRKRNGDVSSVAFGIYDFAEGVDVFDKERRHVLKFGFSQTELTRALAKRGSYLVSEVQKGDKIDAPAFASQIMNAFGDGRVTQSPQQTLARFRRLSPVLTTQDYDSAFLHMWGDFTPRFWLQGGGQEEKSLDFAQDALEKSRKEKLKKRAIEKLPEFRVDSLGAPGTIVSQNQLAGTGITRVKFSNGVYLNYRQMPREDSDLAIDLQLRSDFSKISSNFAQLGGMLSAMQAADIKGYSESQLEDLFAGKKYNFGAQISGQSISLKSNTDRKDLEPALLVLAGFLSGFDDDSLNWRRMYLGNHSTINSYTSVSPIFYGQYYLEHFLSGERSMFKDVPTSNIKSETVSGLKHYFKNGVIELGVTGDFDPDFLIEKVAVTLGALSGRPLSFPKDMTDFNKLTVTPEPEQTFFYAGDDKQMALFYCWPIPNQPETIRKNKTLLSMHVVKNEMVKALRYDNGLAYAPQSIMRDSLQFPDFRHGCAMLQIDPENELKVRQTMQALFERMADGDIDPEDFERARKPLEVDAYRMVESSARMTGIVARAASDDEWVQKIMKLGDWYKDVTFAEIKPHIKEIFGDPAPRLIRIQSYESPWELELRTLTLKAELGDLDAQLALADKHRYDGNGARDPDKEVFWLEKASAQGSLQAHFEAGVFYARGGKRQDVKKAASFFLKAANKDHVDASFKLAQIYSRHAKLFPNVDTAKIASLYKRSAEGGNSDAQEGYARTLLEGTMVPRDREAALMWAYIAADFGNGSMEGRKLTRYTEGLSGDVLKSARKRADVFKDEFKKAGK